MAWVYMAIALGAATFLIFILIDYLREVSGLKPKADYAKAAIREVERLIEAEQNLAEDVTKAVADLKKEIPELEKELQQMTKKVGEHHDDEKRRNPTKFKVEE